MRATVRLRLVPVKPDCDLCERHTFYTSKTKLKQISDITNNVIYFCDKQKSWKVFSFLPYLKNLKKNRSFEMIIRNLHRLFDTQLMFYLQVDELRKRTANNSDAHTV